MSPSTVRRWKRRVSTGIPQKALRLVPKVKREGLRPGKLRGETPIHPATEDLFHRVIVLRRSLPANSMDEERDRLGGCLKVLANATSDAISAEMNRPEVSSGQQQPVSVYGLDAEPIICQGSGPEEPGEAASLVSP